MIFKPAVVEGRYHEASMSNPLELELANETPPSRTWEPLDKDAVKALSLLGVEKKIFNPGTRGAPSLAMIWPGKNDDLSDPQLS
jgi:hypothetical protein